MKFKLELNYTDWERSSPVRTVSYVASLASILIHLLILYSNLIPTHSLLSLSRGTQDIPIEIRDFYKEEKKSKNVTRQIVLSDSTDNDEVDPDSKFLGSRNQKVKQSTVKRAGDGGDPKRTQFQLNEEINESFPEGKAPQIPNEIVKDSKNGVSIPILRDWKKLTLKDLSVEGIGGGPTDDIKNVREADRTILSTKSYVYNSYFKRIRLAIDQFWPRFLNEATDKLWRQGRNIRVSELVTEIQILLDDQGSVKKISIVRASGVPEVDLAAKRVFLRENQFPNPPRGLVDEDGFVRINQSFRVTFGDSRLDFRLTQPAYVDFPPLSSP